MNPLSQQTVNPASLLGAAKPVSDKKGQVKSTDSAVEFEGILEQSLASPGLAPTGGKKDSPKVTTVELEGIADKASLEQAAQIPALKNSRINLVQILNGQLLAQTPLQTTTENPVESAGNVIDLLNHSNEKLTSHSVIGTRRSTDSDQLAQMIDGLIRPCRIIVPINSKTADTKVDTGNTGLNLAPQPELSGKYSIEKTARLASEIQFTARSTDGLNRTVKVTIPASQIQALTSKQINPAMISGEMSRPTVGRVPLDGAPISNNRLDEILSTLNLKEIQIHEPTRTESAMPQTNRNMAEWSVKLVSTSGNEILANGKVRQAESDNKAGSSKKVLSTSAPADDSERVALRQPLQAAITKENAVRTGRTPLEQAEPKTFKVTPELFSFAKESIDPGLQTIIGEESSASSTVQSGKTMATGETRLEMPQVRLSLPENYQNNFKADGKAITLNIEPEILGPVRLSVRLQGGVMHARLIVDSVQVKSIIEGSLDQLTDQLGKAGIKIDQVEVGVAGSDIGGNWFHRTPDWSRPGLTHRGIDLDETQIENEPILSVAPAMANRVHTGGIDVLA